MRRETYRVGVDIGGTFTDLVAVSSSGSVFKKKVSSTPANYSSAIMAGINALLLEIGISPKLIDCVNHGTTVATNAILEEKGAVTALITTQGFRDVLELRRLRRPQLYNMRYEPPRPIVPRQMRLEVDERLGPDGTVRTPLAERSIIAVCNALLSLRPEAVAICLLHSYANPTHEQRLAERVRQVMPDDCYITCSSDILREAREYERTSTVSINAFLGPIVKQYLETLTRGLKDLGVPARVNLMQSNGALIDASSAIRRPASIIESGPAAGVIGAAKVAGIVGIENVIAFDMGGTTAKAALVEGGRPAITSDYEVGAGINLSSKLAKGAGHAVRLPFIDISEIGAGGGSLITFDKAGHLHVGPQSAGSTPGPVCYGRGGTVPTLTDAFVVLGYLNPSTLVGGAVQLDRSAALRVLEPVAARLNKPLLEACFGICQLAASTMVRAVKAVTTYRGRDPREFTLVAYGGNGPLVASAIANILEMSTVLVPPSPGVFSAAGLLATDQGQEFTRSFRKAVAGLAVDTLNDAYRELEAEATSDAGLRDFSPAQITMRRCADLRYAGQAYELTVPIPADMDNPLALAEAFEKEHDRTYGYRSSGDPVDIINLRLFVQVHQDLMSIDVMRLAKNSARESDHGSNLRDAYFGPAHGLLKTRVISRDQLSAAPKEGPFIIEEYDSTCIIPPGCYAHVDASGNLIVRMLDGSVKEQK